MAEPQVHYRPHGYHQQQQQQPAAAGECTKGPSTSQVLAVAALFPVGGVLLTLSGLTLTATVVGLVAVTPLLVVFSPVLVPAAAVGGVALMGFLASGATGLAALSWIVGYMRGRSPEHVESTKRRAQEAAGYVGHRPKDAAGHGIQSRAHEAGGRT